MNDFIHLNRLSIKCLEMISIISKIYNTSKLIVIDPNQENIDEISTFVSEFQNMSVEIPECLVTLLKESVNKDESLETDVRETESGYEL